MTNFDMADISEFLAVVACDYGQSSDTTYISQFGPKTINYLMSQNLITH